MNAPQLATGEFKVLTPYLRRYWRPLSWVVILIVMVVVIDLAQPYLVKETIDRYVTVPHPDGRAILRLAGAYLGLILLVFLLAWYMEVLLQKIGQAIVRELRLDLFCHIQSLSLRYFDQTGAGRIITNVVSDTEAISNFFTQFLANTLRGLLSILLILGFMVHLDRTLALYSSLLIPLIVAISIYFQGRLRAINSEIRSRLGTVIAYLAENLQGMAIVQIFHQEKKQQERFAKLNRAHIAATIRENHYFLLFFNVTELIGDLAIAVLVWFGGGAVLHGTLSFGVLYAFVGYIRRFFQPLNTLTQQLNILQSCLVATERISRTLREVPEIQELAGAVAPPTAGRLHFQQVSLAYQGENFVLHDIELEIRPGERVGFVGATGAGKSSLMNLATRFYDPSRGTVSIDGTDLRAWPLAALRQTVGIVQQDVTLFSGSLLDNIRFFRTGIPREQVMEACRLVGAEPFILRLPQGYDTILSERAATLSAGERQLLSFARVLVFDPRILILDEATASLDSRSEAVLQEAIHRVAQGRTLLVIAHRLATVRDLDTIVVLDHGRIVEAGSHEQLLERQGAYWQLHCSGELLVAAAA